MHVQLIKKKDRGRQIGVYNIYKLVQYCVGIREYICTILKEGRVG